MKIMGVDPGLSGALAILDTESKAVVLMDMPVTVLSSKRVRSKKTGKMRTKDRRAVCGRSIGDFVEMYAPDVAIIESVASRPEQGVVSVFAFGESYGAACGAVEAMNVPVVRVPPAVWKRHVGLLRTDKKASLKKARLLYRKARPQLQRVKDNGRAEALLIAHFYADRTGKLNRSYTKT